MLSPDSLSYTGIGKYIFDAAEVIDDGGERLEVELGEVLDRDPEVFLDGLDQLVRPFDQSPASTLLAPVALAFGMNRSRGIERIETVPLFGLRWRTIRMSLLIPSTPSWQIP